MRGVSLAALLITGCLSAPTDGSGGDPDAAGENLLPNGTFDEGAAGWVADKATLNDDGTPRTGTASLAVCADDPLPTSYGLYTDPAVGLEAGDYAVQLWVRREEGSAAQLVVLNAGFAGNFAMSAPILAGDAWEPVAIEISGAVSEAIGIGLLTEPEEPGDCILVDDARLVRQ